MGESEKEVVCSIAERVAAELIMEKCYGKKGTPKVVGEGMIVYVPEDFIREFEASTGHKFGNPIDENDKDTLEKAIESCKRSAWANRLADKMLGPGAPSEARELLLEKLCYGLLT